MSLTLQQIRMKGNPFWLTSTKPDSTEKHWSSGWWIWVWTLTERPESRHTTGKYSDLSTLPPVSRSNLNFGTSAWLKPSKITHVNTTFCLVLQFPDCQRDTATHYHLLFSILSSSNSSVFTSCSNRWTKTSQKLIPCSCLCVETNVASALISQPQTWRCCEIHLFEHFIVLHRTIKNLNNKCVIWKCVCRI